MPATAAHSVPAPGVYLCQVDATTSCGACCGLYNVADNSRQGLTALLRRRTDRFGEVPREIGPLDDFARWSAAQAGPAPLADFHHCPFIGLLGDLTGAERGRVGCLLHPLAAGNGGVDLRGLSHYGSFTCRTYFCRASRELAGRHQEILRTLFDHWYAYGLVVTETRLVNLLLEEVETRLGARLEPQVVADAPAASAALSHLLCLKIDWPHRRERDRQSARVHYLFNDGAHQRPRFTGAAAKPLHRALFQELVSTFSGLDQERIACRELDAAIDRAVLALAHASQNTPTKRSRHAAP